VQIKVEKIQQDKKESTQNNMSEMILVKDSEWCAIDGELCKVIKFIPWGSIKNGKISVLNKATPYASVVIECKKLPVETTGFICHKMDFIHLWKAFKERGTQESEEVLIFWSKKHYNKLYKIFAAFLPRLWVMICPKGAFESMTDPNYKPEIQGEARYKAEKPIVEWKPEMMR